MLKSISNPYPTFFNPLMVIRKKTKRPSNASDPKDFISYLRGSSKRKKSRRKKKRWWKRIVVFLLGVAQIVVGAIITASTAGALSGFGVNMMVEGAKDCFNSIFSSDKLNDLKKYFS